MDTKYLQIKKKSGSTARNGDLQHLLI